MSMRNVYCHKRRYLGKISSAVNIIAHFMNQDSEKAIFELYNHFGIVILIP